MNSIKFKQYIFLMPSDGGGGDGGGGGGGDGGNAGGGGDGGNAGGGDNGAGSGDNAPTPAAPAPDRVPQKSDYQYGDGQQAYQNAIAEVNKYRSTSTPTAANLLSFFAGPLGVAKGVTATVAQSSEAYNSLSDTAKALVNSGTNQTGGYSDGNGGGGNFGFVSQLPTRGNIGVNPFSPAPITPKAATIPNAVNSYPLTLDGAAPAPVAVIRTAAASSPAPVAASASAPVDQWGKWASILTVLTLGFSLLKGGI